MIQAIKNISILWMGSILGAGCAFLTQVILARSLGPESFGLFASAMATVVIFTPLAGFGISQYWLKLFGQEGWQGTRWLRHSFQFVGISTTLVILILLAWGLLGPHDRIMRLLLWTLSIYILGQVMIDLVSGKLQLEERFIVLALWQFAPHLLRLLIVFVLSFPLIGLMNTQNVALTYSCVAIPLLIIGWFQLYQMINGNFDIKGHNLPSITKDLIKPNIKSVIVNTFPFGMASLFFFVYYQSDIVLIKYITGSQAAGLYNVAFTVMTAVYLLPTVIIQKFLLPKIHRWSIHDRNQLYKVYRQGNIIMFILGLAAMIIIWSTSLFAIPFLFGEPYRSVIPLLNILAVCSPIFFVAINVGATLVTQDHIKKKVRFMGAVAVLNITLNIFLIPKFGASGAAAATVISNMVLLTTYYLFAQKIVFKDIANK